MSIIWSPKLDSGAQAWLDTAAALTKDSFEPLAEELDREQRYPWELSLIHI